jgi:DNA-binding beta-propeller fold protein YncE
VAGGGTLSGSASEGEPATNALLSFPYGLALDAAGNLFIADPGASFVLGDAFDNPSADRIFKVAPDGIITNVAGNGVAGYSSDGCLATRASFNGPAGLAIDNAGNVYVADLSNNEVRILRPIRESVFNGCN